MIGRRDAMLGAGALMLLGGCGDWSAARGETREAGFSARLDALGRSVGGRLGAFALDSGTGRSIGTRQSERFGMCSTFKLSLCALVLREADAGRLRLDEVLPYSREDLLFHSPVTEAHVASGGMTIAALAEAAQMVSDNLAANLLLKRIGGPAAVTTFWRSLGDKVSRLDRNEPELNFVPPGEIRDTTTPEAIARSVAKFALGDVLSKSAKARLGGWMERTDTGLKRIRAALPEQWRGGDKTGTGMAEGMPNRCNDIAVLHRPHVAPLVIAAFYEADGYYKELREQDEAVLAAVGRLVVEWAS